MTRSSTIWPQREDYQRAVLQPPQHLRDPRLQALQVEMTQMGVLQVPRLRSGNFGAVYKLGDGRRAYALKVFDRFQPDREQRYQLIHEHLSARPPSPHLMSFDYDPEGIFIPAKARLYPSLVMDWVEGQPLDLYLGEALAQYGRVANGSLCRAWRDLVLDLRGHGLAHGDLQHGNILVLADGALKLVDYDGMFVPAMAAAGLRAAEIGLPAYQHPARDRGYFDERLDDFSALVILLSLACLDGPRWQRYHTDDDGLLLHEADLVRPEQSPLLRELKGSADEAVRKLAVLVTAAARKPLDAIPPFHAVVADGTIRGLFAGSDELPQQRASRTRGAASRPAPAPAVDVLPADRDEPAVVFPPARRSDQPPQVQPPRPASRGGARRLITRASTVISLLAVGVVFALLLSARSQPLPPSPPVRGTAVRQAAVVALADFGGGRSLAVRCSVQVERATAAAVKVVVRIFSADGRPAPNGFPPAPSHDHRRGWGLGNEAGGWQIVDVDAPLTVRDNLDLVIPQGALRPGSGYYAEVVLADAATNRVLTSPVRTAPFTVAQ